MKRLLIILGILVGLTVLVIGLYFLFKPQAKLTVSSGNSFGDTGAGIVSSNSTVEEGTGAGNAGTVVAPNLIKITNGPVSAGEVAFDIPPAIIQSSSTVAASLTRSVTTFVSTTTTATSSRTATRTQAVTTPSQTPATTQATTYSPGDVAVRYIDRESGNVYEYRALTRKLSRVSNKTLPGIQEASWLPDGSMAFVRFLSQTSGASHISTYALPYDGNGGYFLQQDLSQTIVIGSSTVFVMVTGTDNSIGSSAHADGTGVKTLFSSPLTSIVARAAGNSSIMTVTKAASELDGFAFSVSGSGSNSFTPILGPLKGLTILPSPSGKVILYSYADGTAFHMATLDLNSGTVTNLPLSTLAEKCVWASSSTALYCAVPTSFPGNLPDDWYQGAVTFSDRIWRIDLTTRLATLVLDPLKSGKTDIDAVNLTLDPNSQVLIFRNKKDSSLWAYSL